MDEWLDKLEKISSFNTAKAKKGLARLLHEASQNPMLGCQYGGRIAALDLLLFDKKRIPPASAVFLCSFLLFAGFLVVMGLYAVSLSPLFQFICLCASFFCFWFFSHDLAHFVVGSLLGIRFPFFFSGKSNLRFISKRIPFVGGLLRNIPALRVKIDYTDFFCISKKRRRAMFASGACASMILPFFVLATAWEIETESWVRILTSVLVCGNIMFTMAASYFFGDFAKVRRQQ